MTPGTEYLIKQFKALADPLRMRIIALCSQGECSVSELTEVLAQSQPRISQHLKILCESGLLERFRDGHFVFYRLPTAGDGAAASRRLFALLPDKEPDFERDIAALRETRGVTFAIHSDEDRPLHHALIELTVSMPLGDLLDIGSGQGRILKLLASRAQRAVGVDIDADARRFARAAVLLAGLPNCTLRQGDMYSLPFKDTEFDTVIVDDVLVEAARPVDVLAEALRLIQPGGRLLVLTACNERDARPLSLELAAWCRDAGLRLSPPRSIPANRPRWLLAVATGTEAKTAAA